MEVPLMKHNTTDAWGGVNTRWCKTAVVILLLALFARGLATQGIDPQGIDTQVTDSPAIFVAHPWDPSTPPTGNPDLIDEADPAPVANVWTAIGPAPIANGQR